MSGSGSHPEVFVKRSAIPLAVTVAAAVSVSACGPRPLVIEPTPYGAVVRDAKIGMYSKNVLTKKVPDTFLAEDGTICRVPADRFKDTPVHTLVYCDWQ